MLQQNAPHLTRNLLTVIKLLLISLLVTAAATSLFVPTSVSHGDGDDEFTLNLPEKTEQAYPSLGSQLNQAVAMVEGGLFSDQEAASQSPISSGGSVAVTIFLSSNVDDVVQFLEDNGGDPRNVGEDYIEATCRCPCWASSRSSPA